MSTNTPQWLPDWLQEALTKPTMDVPTAGRAVFNADRHQAYALARGGTIPTIKSPRRRQVATMWVRRMLMLDDGPPPAA